MGGGCCRVEEGCHRMRCLRRGARASFLPGSGTRTRRKQVKNLAAAPSEHAPQSGWWLGGCPDPGAPSFPLQREGGRRDFEHAPLEPGEPSSVGTKEFSPALLSL